MWPYTENEFDWTSSHATHFDNGQPITPTPEMIEHYINRGHSMRAMALRAFVLEAWNAGKKLVSSRLQTHAARKLAHH